jgi:hypothetical protein
MMARPRHVDRPDTIPCHHCGAPLCIPVDTRPQEVWRHLCCEFCGHTSTVAAHERIQAHADR